jgi:hypothetical protein
MGADKKSEHHPFRLIRIKKYWFQQFLLKLPLFCVLTFF